MGGHSHWSTIKRHKGAVDAKRGKIFTKLIREITIAARAGGGDLTCNPRLRLAVDKAKAQSMPKDNIERAVKRGSGELDGDNFEEVRYEGYGPSGVAVMVDCLTDNRNRTVAEVRHAFSKFGGNLGTGGSVAYLFKHVGLISYPTGTSEEALMEAALEAGADDIITNEDGSIDVITSPEDFVAVKGALVATGYAPDVAEVTMRAATSTPVDLDDAQTMLRLLDTLEDLDDVQKVYSNADIPEDILAQLT